MAVLLAAITSVGMNVLPTAQASTPPGAPRPAILDVTGWKVQSIQASATDALNPLAGDGIGPGSYLLITRTDGEFICTANFVWSGSNGTTYLGAAGHCFLPSGVAAGTGSVSRVQVCVQYCAFGGQLGAIVQGTFDDLGPVAYARQQDASGTEEGNDFGLVAIPSNLSSLIRHSVPVWGGPSGPGAVRNLLPVCMYGNGVVAGETWPTKARTGLGEGDGATVGFPGAFFAVLAATPGDSGSAVVNCDPSLPGGLQGTTAVGILTAVTALGVVGTTVQQAAQLVQNETTFTITL